MERSVAETVPCIDRSATVQQECDDPNEIVSDSFVKRSGTLATAFTPRTPAVEKKRGHLNAVVLTSDVKRSATKTIPCIDLATLVEEMGGDHNVVVSASPAQRCGPLTVFLIEHAPVLEKKPNNRKGTVPAGQAEGGQTKTVFHLDRRATFKKKPGKPGQRGTSDVKRSVTVTTWFINRSATVEEKRGNFNVVLHASSVKRRLAITIFSIDCSATVEEKRGNFNVVLHASSVKRRLAITIFSIDCSATVEEKRGHLNVVLLARSVKRSLAPTTFCIDCSATVEEKGSNRNARGTVKRSLTDPIFDIDCSAMIEEKRGNLETVLTACFVKRRGTQIISGSDRTATVEKKFHNFNLVLRNGSKNNTSVCELLQLSIEVQRTPTHVAGLYCVEAPFDVDSAALLAQRRNSERGRRRRQLDDPSSFQPADVVVGCQLLPANLQAHRLNVQLGEHILQRCLESGQSPALGIHLHRHFLFAPQCCELHCCVCVYVPVVSRTRCAVA